MVKFSFKTQDGSETVSATASLGLLHWYMRHIPKLPMPDPMPILEVVQSGKPMPGPYHPNFFTLVISVIERTYGKAPEVSPELFWNEWYKDLGQYSDFKKVIADRDAGHGVVNAYEDICLFVLKWLSIHGDVRELTVTSEIKK